MPEGFGFGKGDETELTLVEQRSDFGEFGFESCLVDHRSKPAVALQKMRQLFLRAALANPPNHREREQGKIAGIDARGKRLP